MNGAPLPTPPGSAVTRREMLATAARWSVPTVVTITLGVRVLEAKASCPPCTKRNAGKCKACTISQILNCQCEPCLGPPYCTVAGGAPPAASRSASPGAQGLSGTTGGVRAPSGAAGIGSASRQEALDRYLGGRTREQLRNDPLRSPLYRDPFGVRADSAGRRQPGLYDRLRPEPTGRRRP